MEETEQKVQVEGLVSKRGSPTEKGVEASCSSESAEDPPQGLRCTVCYTFLGSTQETIETEQGDQHSSFTSIRNLFECLRFDAFPRAGTLEDINLPICLLCEENLVEVKRVIDQITELENVVQSLEEDMKSKLLNSFDESSMDVWRKECHLMVSVSKVRAEMVQQFQKRVARGRKRTEINSRKRNSKELLVKKEVVIPEVIDSDKMKQDLPELRKTSSGRVVKRPRTYSDMIEESENVTQGTSENDEDEKLDIILGDTDDGADYCKRRTQMTEKDTENPMIDPEWSPPRASDLVNFPSTISDAEDEAVEVPIKLNRSSTRHTNTSFRKKRKVNTKPHSSVREYPNPTDSEVTRVPVKVKTKAGEIFNGAFFDFEDTRESLGTVNKGHVFGLEDMKSIQGLRLTCFEVHCPRTFTTLDKLKSHFKKVHPNSSAGLRHSCKLCDQKFSSLQQLRTHVKELHCETLQDSEFRLHYHPCTFEGCTRAYRNSKELKIHIRAIHTGETPFSCDFCEEKFVSLVKKEIHVETLHPEAAPLKCEFCHKAFFRNHRLRDHMKSHTGEKRYLCDLCGQGFSQPAYLRYHQTKHTELKLEPYKCPECDKTFATPVNLRIHRKTQHLKDYRFRCEVCNHGATHKSHLKLHMRTHSGERPYSCPQCEKTFTRGSQLTIHLRSHTGERPYKCQSCEKSFTNSSKLRRHEHVHSSEKPFKCTICEKAFSQATNLNSHIRSCHTHKKEPKRKQPEPPPQFTTEIRQDVIQFPTHVFGLVDQNIHIQVIDSSEGLDGSAAFTEYILLNP